LGAVLERTVFVGHDSGISHLAVAAGANCVLLFGKTDPDIWAPQGENVRIIRAPGGDLNALQIATVRDAIQL
jgi:heptosyltransferase-2